PRAPQPSRITKRSPAPTDSVMTLVARDTARWSGGPHFTEISVADQLIFAQLGGCTTEHDLAGLQYIGAISDLKGHIGVLFDHKDCSTLPIDRPNNVKDLLHIGGRQAHRRLVHAQELGPGHQSATDRDHLLLAPRQGAGDLAEPFLDRRKEGEDASQILLDPRSLRSPIPRPPRTRVRGVGYRRPSRGFRTPPCAETAGAPRALGQCRVAPARRCRSRPVKLLHKKFHPMSAARFP